MLKYRNKTADVKFQLLGVLWQFREWFDNKVGEYEL